MTATRGISVLIATSLVVVIACATDPAADVLDEYTEVNNTTILSAPEARASRMAPSQSGAVARGKYLVELLGCAACHTDGALVGNADPAYALAGSKIGIAFTNPLGDDRPGIVYPSNLTPDVDTGIGAWSDAQIAAAIRAGQGRHGDRRIAVMPWQGYARLNAEDTTAIVQYLRSIDPVRHRVPDEVEPGSRASARFVYFGVYEQRRSR